MMGPAKSSSSGRSRRRKRRRPQYRTVASRKPRRDDGCSGEARRSHRSRVLPRWAHAAARPVPAYSRERPSPRRRRPVTTSPKLHSKAGSRAGPHAVVAPSAAASPSHRGSASTTISRTPSVQWPTGRRPAPGRSNRRAPRGPRCRPTELLRPAKPRDLRSLPARSPASVARVRGLRCSMSDRPFSTDTL